VGTQIEEVIRAHRPWGRSRCRAAAEAALDEVGLGDEPGAARAYPHELSGGQQKRILIAQAIACRPRLLVADEPVSALDAVTRAGILALLGELKERLGLSMLLIAHELSSLTALADRLAVMYAGRFVEEGPTGALLGEPLHPYTRGLLAAQPQPRSRKRLTFIPGGPPDPTARPEGCAFEPRCPARKEACASRHPGEVQPAPQRRVRCFEHGG
jgi:oligopeptide/dipeptide ABC transporter ATP-binding protein